MKSGRALRICPDLSRHFGGWKEQETEHEKNSDGGRTGSKLLEKIGALCRNTECQKKPRTVAASPAKRRKVATSNSRARSCVNQTTTKGRNICMRTLKK